MQLLEEWKEILNQSSDIYIYGAGKIGRKIYSLIKREAKVSKFRGFLVTDIKGNPDNIEGNPVRKFDSIDDKESTILVSVTDIYQNEIIMLLEQYGFKNVVCAYKFYPLVEQEDVSSQRPNVIDIDLRELLAQQYCAAGFNRYDIIVRLLAIENFYDKNNYGFTMYKKMQNYRVRDGYDTISELRFRDLILSVENKGFDVNSEIFVDNDLRLLDGSHRVALAFYHNVKKVRVRILNRQEKISYEIDWFKQYFDENELDILRDYEKKIYQASSCVIKGIVWPSAFAHITDIMKTVEQECVIENYTDYTFPQKIFERFVKGIYQIDDIAEWKIETKLAHFGESEEYCVRIIDLKMENPEFRVKHSGTTISKKGEELKKIIREEYKDKVENYFHDIIFHTADNYYQSEYIQAMLEKAFSLEELFEEINDLEWMLIKYENNYFPKDFPKSYPMYKDIDLICAKNDMDVLVERVSRFFNNHENGMYKVRVVQREGRNCQIRFELEGFLIFLVDVFVFGTNSILKEEFIIASLLRREKEKYYRSTKRDEMIYRIVECYKYPHKTNHIKYVKDNIKELDVGYLTDCIDDTYADEIMKFVVANEWI